MKMVTDTHFLLPFTKKIDMAAPAYAVHFAKQHQAPLVPLALILLSGQRGAAGPRLEAIEQANDFLEAVKYQTARIGAVASVTPQGVSSIANPGPHGLSEILYLYTSGNGNNGSAMAGIRGNIPFYNWTGGFAMLIGRFAFLIPILAFGGSLVKKQVVPAGLGTFPTTGPLFVGLLVGVILIVGTLTYFPAYSPGLIVEQLLMQAGRVF
jgi:hypothetical protein